MPPTLKRILWAGVPAAVLLAGVGFVLAEVAGLFLEANRPPREVTVIDEAAPAEAARPASPLPADARLTLPLTMAAWGFGLVTAYEVIRRLIKGPAKPPATAKVPVKADVDKLLEDLLRKAEADRTGEVPALPPAAGRPAQ